MTDMRGPARPEGGGLGLLLPVKGRRFGRRPLRSFVAIVNRNKLIIAALVLESFPHVVPAEL